MPRPVVVLALLAGLAPASASARVGDPDRGFGHAGAVSLGSREGSALGGAVLPLGSGRVLAGGSVAGRLVVLRLRAAGALDRGFGVRGQVAPLLPGASAEGVRGLAMFRDGRIVAAGTLLPGAGGGTRFAVFRLLPRGEIDPSFGGGAGYVLAGPEGATLAAIDTDNNQDIVLAGARATADGGEVPVVQRLLPDGTPDPSFGANGVVDGAALGLAGRATDVLVLRDGSVAFSAGAAQDHDGPAVLTAVHLTSTGAPDPGFGAGNGIASVTVSPGVGRGLGAAALSAGPGGRLLVAGTALSSHGTPRAVVLRLAPNGALDPRFGHGGLARVSRRGRPLRVLAMTRMGGTIVLAGTATAPAGLVVTLRANGRRPVVRFPVLGRPRGGGAAAYTELAAVAADRAGRLVTAGSVAPPAPLLRTADGTRYLGTFTLTVARLHGR